MRLSVSIIAKNEEMWMRPIINDCKKFADEIVLCDTGSTDNTVEIAKSMGCKVVCFTWNNSFSDARNASLNACSGRYVMWVDCDDRIPKSQQLQLRRLKKDYLSKGKTSAYLINMITDNGEAPSYMEQLRIFPKLHDNMWSGRVHESVFEALSPHKIPIESTNIWVYHEGYTDQEMLDSKIKRNIELLRKDIKETDNPIKVSYLGATLANIGDKKGAMEELAKIYDNEKLKSHKGQRFTYLMRLIAPLYDAKEYAALWGAMEQAKKLYPNDIQPWAVQANLSFEKRKFDLAQEMAVEALKRDYDYEAGLPMINEVREKMMMLLEVIKNLNQEEAYV